MERIHRRIVQKDLNELDNYKMWSVTQSQTFSSVKSSRPWESLLSIKLVDAMELQ